MRTVFARGGGVDHWVAPLRARVEGLKSLKQLSDVRLLHPLMLRQALKVVQHVCVHPVISALGLDTSAALHAELQDWIVVADPYALAPGTTRRLRRADRLKGRYSD